MQQLKNKQENEILKKEVENNIILTNRKQIKLSGIEEVLSSNENSLLLKTNTSKLEIMGSNLSITKLDIENKILEAVGIFKSIKYINKQEKFWGKLFKWI